MGKPKKDEEEMKATPGNTGTVDVKKLNKFAADYQSQKADMDEARGEIGALMKDFEEQGGHKKALKHALALKGMETSKAQDYIRSFEYYCHALGVYDQHDLFDSHAEKKAKEQEEDRQRPIGAAAPKAPSMPSASTH